MSKNLVLVDGDGLLYHSSKETLEESIQSINERIYNILEKTNADYYIIFISNSPYFRHRIDSEYKSQRKKYKSPLLWLKSLKAYLIENWNAQSMKDVEADDLISYWANTKIGYAPEDREKYFDRLTILQDAKEYLKENWNQDYNIQEFNIILSSPDKDLLKSIPGRHFNYTYKLLDKSDINSLVEGEFVETNLEDSVEFKATQLLMGDSADSIKCLGGIGEKKAKKILESWNEGSIESFILATYIEHLKDSAKAIYEFQKNYRLLHLLENDEDFLREVGKLPLFPKIQKVNKEIKEEDLI